MEPSEGYEPSPALQTTDTHGDSVAIPDGELRRLYADYRLRQARSLLSLMPKAAVRPLYRRAIAVQSRERAESPAESGGSDVVASDSRAPGRLDNPDPMAVILAFAESLLPLPPFEVWLADFQSNPEAHWQDLEGSADVPSPSEPATVETRQLRVEAQGWNAHLRGFRDDDVWRGFIAFEDMGVVPPRVHRTAVIFREESLDDLRARFRDFESASLEAFLRSSLS